MNFRDFTYSYFGWSGRLLHKLVPDFENSLDSANMKIHPEVYLSFAGFAGFVSSFVFFALYFMVHFNIVNLPNIPFLNEGMLIMYLPPVLLLIAVTAIYLPKAAAVNRVSSLKIEIPYASMYISIMTSGGLSPFESILRLQKMDLLPSMQEEVRRIELIVKSQGLDPVTAMEKAAKVMGLKEYKELLLGYASSVRTGGDTLNYLFNQTDRMFRSLSTRIKSLGENMGMLMEAYAIIGILGVLGLFLIYVVGMALPSMGTQISPNQFFFFSFVVLPMLSVVFIYAGDAAQISYPVSNWKAYSLFAGFLPVGLFLGSQLILPAFTNSFLVVPQLYELLLSLRDMLGLMEGTEAALGMTLTLILIAIPGVIGDRHFVGRDEKILGGIGNFLRDLVETRKSGLAPERCIHALANKDYGAFSEHLQTMSMRLKWGTPLRDIYEEFRAKIRNWLALVNIYLLIDTIEVGGGTEKSLETLASFSELTKQLEDEKKAVLMPLTIVPYIGAALLTGTTVLFLQFFTGMSGIGVSVAHVTLYRVLLTPLSLHSWVLGLVTGKIVSGRVSAGFKHSIVMSLISLAGIWVISSGMISVGGF